MPNWCSNRVIITHEDPAKITWIESAVNSDSFMNTVVPRPQQQEDNWYDWNCANWGTKWDVDAEISDQDQNSITIYFDSAWSPPIAFYKNLEDMGFEVEATYYESGMAIAGIYKDGEDEYYEFGSMTADEIKATLPQDLNDEYDISESVRSWQEQEYE